MIYLLKSPCWNSNYVRYKVGYTSDVDKRLKQYEPETLLIATRPGSEPEERILHKRLKLIPSLIKVYRREWYVVRKDNSSVIEVFHESKKLMKKIVWKSYSLEELTEIDCLMLIYGN